MTEKEKIRIEFQMNCTERMLYGYLSTTDGLSEWFADEVNKSKDNIYTFIWAQSEQTAKVLSKRTNDHIRYRWQDQDLEDKSYFEFKLNKDELTRDLTLIVIDFCEPDEKMDTIDLWESQISELKRILGA